MRTIAKIAVCAALALSALPAPAGEVEDLERRIRETEERIAREKKRADEAAARARELDAKARDARRLAAEKGGEADAQNRRADREKRRLDSSVRAAEDGRRRIADGEKKLVEQQAGVRNLENIRSRNVNEEQVEKLKRASKAQDDIAERLALLREILESDEPDPVKLVRENRAENPLVTKDAAPLAIADAYELAKELENAITESYKDIKATQTAIDQRMDFEAAQQITDVAKAVRLEADREALEETPRTKEALDAQKVAQAEVVRETDNIVETAVAMMKEALEIVKPEEASEEAVQGPAPKTIEWMREEDFADRDREEARKRRLEEMAAAADFQVAITEAAAENEEDRAKDLTKLMEDAAEAAREKQAETAEAAEAAEAAKSEKDAEDGPTAAANRPTPGALEPPDPKRRNLAGGNLIRFSPDAPGDGVPAKWMYVRDWYSIGPFPNPDRINIRRKFPPESVVDLDATYVGKDGKTIRWEFMQTRNAPPKEAWLEDARASAVPPNVEEYGIWYAYAEVFCDVACDRWIAVGSDDRSDVWINDVPVWGSSNKLKSWRIDEGFRRIRLEKGRNRILARVENGWMGLCWSLCISLEDGEIGL
jgi:hypothetical protein